jgi:hypothetical protein
MHDLLPGKTTTLKRKDPSGNWSTVKTTTDANGAYTFTRPDNILYTLSEACSTGDVIDQTTFLADGHTQNCIRHRRQIGTQTKRLSKPI